MRAGVLTGVPPPRSTVEPAPPAGPISHEWNFAWSSMNCAAASAKSVIRSSSRGRRRDERGVDGGQVGHDLGPVLEQEHVELRRREHRPAPGLEREGADPALAVARLVALIDTGLDSRLVSLEASAAEKRDVE